MLITSKRTISSICTTYNVICVRVGGCNIKTYFLLLLLYPWNLHDNIFFSTLRSIASDVRVQLNHPPVQLEHTFQHYVHAKRLPTVGIDIKVSFTTRGPTEDVLPYPVRQSTKGTERTEVTHLLYAYKITVEHASALIVVWKAMNDLCLPVYWLACIGSIRGKQLILCAAASCHQL